MALNKTIAATAAAGVLGVGAAALTFPAGDSAAQEAAANPTVRTEVVHRSRQKPRRRGAAPAVTAAPVVVHDRFDDHGGHGEDEHEDHSGHGHGGDDD